MKIDLSKVEATSAFGGPLGLTTERRCTVKTLLLMTILSGVLISPAFAQMSAEDMTCAAFSAMDSSGQMAAVDKMAGAMKSGDTGAMKSGSMSSDQMSSDQMSSDKMASGGMASDTPMTAESVAAACADHPDMMVHEAMMAR